MFHFQKYSIQADNLRKCTDLPNISLNFKVELAIELYNFAKHEELELKTSLTKWMAILCNMEENSINAAAVIAKIHRCLNILKGKGEMQNIHMSVQYSISLHELLLHVVKLLPEKVKRNS